MSTIWPQPGQRRKCSRSSAGKGPTGSPRIPRARSARSPGRFNDMLPLPASAWLLDLDHNPAAFVSGGHRGLADRRPNGHGQIGVNAQRAVCRGPIPAFKASVRTAVDADHPRCCGTGSWCGHLETTPLSCIGSSRMMPCQHVTLKDGTPAIACTGRRGRKRCSACKRTWATLECDFPTPARKSGTCDKPLCQKCAVSKGDNLDFCPHHPADATPGPSQLGMALE